MRKKADPNMSFVQALKGMAKTPTFLAAMSAPVIGFAVGKGEDYLSNRRNAQMKSTAFKEMLDLHPHLRQRDQGEVSRIYNSLHNASPNMARDPMVAGAWVDEIIENKTPGMNSHHALLNAVKDLSGIQKNVSDVERANQQGARPFAHYLSSSLPAVGRAVDQYRRDNIDLHFQRAQEENERAVAKKKEEIASQTAKYEAQKRKAQGAYQTLRGQEAAYRKQEEKAVRQQARAQQADQYLADRWTRWRQQPDPGGVHSPVRSARASNPPPPWENEAAGAFRAQPGRASDQPYGGQVYRGKTGAARTELGAILRALKV